MHQPSGTQKPLQITLVAPRNPASFWSMEGTAQLFGATTLMPPTGLATLAALTPDELDVRYTLFDENVKDVDFDLPADVAVVTGFTLNAPRIRELCSAFTERGVPVALGGPYATIHADACEELCDHLFVGEAEHTWPRFLRDLAAGSAAAVYREETHVALAESPPPDWSLIDPSDYLEICVQTTRGCPHACEFCDVIRLLGRRCRTKSVNQVLRELQNVVEIGGHSVFFSDDNFLGNRVFTRKLVDAIIDWNTGLDHPLAFSTQITMDVADDEALLRALADARFSVLFLGVETVRRESLAEVQKERNLDRDPVARVRDISRYGLVPFLGLMVGFDHDDMTVFDELEAFVEDTAAPIVGISLVNAPRNTPLYERLAAEGRLVGDDFSGEWQLGTNIVPKLMTREQLWHGYWKLFRRIYEPKRFEARLRRWLDQVEYRTGIYTNRKKDLSQLKHIASVARYLALRADPPVRNMFLRSMAWGWRAHPHQMRRLFTYLGQYRHFNDFIEQSTRG